MQFTFRTRTRNKLHNKKRSYGIMFNDISEGILKSESREEGDLWLHWTHPHTVTHTISNTTIYRNNAIIKYAIHLQNLNSHAHAHVHVQTYMYAWSPPQMQTMFMSSSCSSPVAFQLSTALITNQIEVHIKAVQVQHPVRLEWIYPHCSDKRQEIRERKGREG